MRKVLIAAVSALALVGSYACASDCENGCEKLKECLGEDLVTDTCVDDCQKSVDDEATSADVQACMDCINSNECEAIFPAADSGEESVCAEACGYGAEAA